MATFVLIPGGWQGGWVFDAVVASLADKGHVARGLTLAGLGDEPRPDANLDTHVAQVVDAIDALDASDGELVLAAQSYGGMVASGAADARPGRPRALVYVDAYVPEDGDSTWSLTTPAFRDVFIAGARADGRLCAPPPGMDARCRAQPMATFLQAARLSGAWRQVPRKTYVGAHGWDGSPFLDLYRRLGRDPAWSVHALDCGHNVARHAPQALVEILLAQLDA